VKQQILTIKVPYYKVAANTKQKKNSSQVKKKDKQKKTKALAD